MGKTIKVELRKSRYGTPQPTLRMEVDTGYLIAAAVERSTPADQTWVVVVDHYSAFGGDVHLEISAVEDPDEITSGMKVLQVVADALAYGPMAAWTSPAEPLPR